MARRIGWTCLAFSIVAFLANTTEAQIWHTPARAVQAPLRYLGHGNGPGYHHCNPGPDSSYYNPWSQKNSVLISQSPQFLARYGHELRRSPMEILHQGNMTWGHQNRFGQQQPALVHPSATPLSADFVPSTPSSDMDEEQQTNEDGNSGGDFQPSPSDEEVEDRFEEEADAIDSDANNSANGNAHEAAEEQTEDSIGGFDSLKDSIDSSNEAAVLLPPLKVFRPASYSGR